jgi:dCTP deaminase
MATLPDHQIRHYAETANMIEPFRISQLNPASYDVRLGPTLKTEAKNAYGSRWFLYHLQHGPYIMAPGEFLLGVVEEIINVPADMECNFMLKSSLARDGMNHSLAAFADPGYNGRMTIELKNLSPIFSLKLEVGMLIGQVRFSRLESPCETPYGVNGHYQGDMTVKSAKLNGCVYI